MVFLLFSCTKQDLSMKKSQRRFKVTALPISTFQSHQLRVSLEMAQTPDFVLSLAILPATKQYGRSFPSTTFESLEFISVLSTSAYSYLISLYHTLSFINTHSAIQTPIFLSFSCNVCIKHIKGQTLSGKNKFCS